MLLTKSASFTDTNADEEVARRVSDELRWDTCVRVTDVAVTVVEGTATLTGTADSHAARLAAQEAAYRVIGVLNVVNQIGVSVPSGRRYDDAQLARAVRQALAWDVCAPEAGIRATVSRGWVTLEGAVENIHQRGDATRAVGRLTGVAGVTNTLSVHPAAVDAASTRLAIEAALARRVEPEGARIDVLVDGGRVTLRGRVHAWAQKRTALAAAEHAPGVQQVFDELIIDPAL